MVLDDGQAFSTDTLNIVEVDIKDKTVSSKKMEEPRVCESCNTMICKNHMHTYTCVSCSRAQKRNEDDTITLCSWCHKKYHSGHARWDDVPYEI